MIEQMSSSCNHHVIHSYLILSSFDFYHFLTVHLTVNPHRAKFVRHPAPREGSGTCGISNHWELEKQMQMGVSINGGTPKSSIYRFPQQKPSIWGYPHGLENPKFMQTSQLKSEIDRVGKQNKQEELWFSVHNEPQEQNVVFVPQPEAGERREI